MRKITAFLFLAFCLTSNARAQKKIVDSLLDWLAKHPTIDSQHILTLHRVSWRSVDYDLKQSFEYYDKVSYYSDSLHFIFGKGLAQINLGVLFTKAANFDASNKAFFKAIEYAEACGGMRLKSASLDDLGENFKTLKDFDRCREYVRQAIPINIGIKAWIGVGINYELLQQCDLEEKLYDSARSNLVKGLPYAILSKDSSLIMQFYLGFGKLHAVNGRIDSALYYFNYAINESKRNGHPVNEYDGYISQVKYFQQLQPDEKRTLLTKAMQIAKETKSLDKVAATAHQLSSFYDQYYNKDSSELYYKLYRATADSLFSENNRRNVSINETEWMVRRQEIENIHLKELASLQNKDLSIKNGLLIAVFISLILLIITAFVIYKSIQNNKRNTESQLKQNIAESQMQALRSQMNPHFIFNSLNSIDAFIQSNDKYNATVYLNKFAKLIRNILDSSKENLISFSKDIETLRLYIDLEEQRSENKFITQLDIDSELMESDFKVPPLIIQPFVENAILHGLRNRAFNDGILSIDISKNDKSIIYSITDNGIGRSAAAKLKKNKDKSYGIEMSYDRIKLFNREVQPSVLITDLYRNGKASGTNVRVLLNII